MAHAVAFVFAFLHWVLYWHACAFKAANNGFGGHPMPGVTISMGSGGSCREMMLNMNSYYSWFLLVVWILWLAAIVVNFVVDQKKGNGQMTSIVAILALCFSIYYLIAYWVGDKAKALYDLPKEMQTGSHRAGKVFYWFFIFTSIPAAALPAVMGGLSGGSKI